MSLSLQVSKHPRPIALRRRPGSPSGPVTVILRLNVLRYDVMSFLTNRSPIVRSTPGGTESGVRPSLEGRCVVAEKGRRDAADCAAAVWKAGTREPGSVTVEEGVEARARCRACRPVLGASIVARRTGNSRRALRWVWVNLQLMLHSKKIGRHKAWLADVGR